MSNFNNWYPISILNDITYINMLQDIGRISISTFIFSSLMPE